MSTNNNYKITDINVTAAVIGKPLTINGAALYSNTDGYYGPYAYKVTQDNAGKKRFKEVVFDPVTFDDVEIWHPISAGDGIAGTIQVDPDDNTKYVFKTKMDYALNLALFLIGDKRGDGFTFAVEDDNGMLVEYILHRDEDNNPTVERKVDPQQILNSVREDVIAIATANSLKLDTVLDAISSNIADGTIQLPMSKLTDDHGNPVDLNSMFMLSTEATNFVPESQATNFILTDNFKNLLATNLGLNTTSDNIGDDFFRTQLNNNTNFSSIIQSSINDQLSNNTNLNEMIGNIVATNENLVHTNYLVNLATTNDIASCVEYGDIISNGHIKDNLISANIVRAQELDGYATTNLLTDYAQKNELFANGILKDEIIPNNVARTGVLGNFVAATNLFNTNNRIDESLIDSSLMRSASFSSALAESLGVPSTAQNIGDEFFRTQINNNPQFGDVISSSISYELANNTNFETYVANAVAQNTNIVMSSALGAYAQTSQLAGFVASTDLFVGSKINDTLLSSNVAMATDLANLVDASELAAYAQTTQIFSGGKIKDELIGNNVLRTNNTNYFSNGMLRSDRVNIPNDVIRSNDQVLNGLVYTSSSVLDGIVYTSNTAFVTNAVTSSLVDSRLPNNVLRTNDAAYFVNGTIKSDKIQLPSGIVMNTNSVLQNIVYTTNTAFVTDAVNSNVIASNLPDNVLKTDSQILNGLVYTSSSVLDGIVYTSNTAFVTNAVNSNVIASNLPENVVKFGDDVLDNIVYTSNTTFVSNAINSNMLDAKLPSNVVRNTSSVLQNIVYTTNTAFVTNSIDSNVISNNLPEDVLRTTDTDYFVDGQFAASKMPDTLITTSTIDDEMANNASVIIDQIADINYDDFGNLLVDTPIDNSLENLLDVVKDTEIPEIALRTVMSDYNGYAYCTITNSTNELARLTSWNSVSESDRKAVILEVDAVNASKNENDLDSRANNYVYLLPNNMLKDSMVTDRYIPCDDPEGHKIDIYTKNTNGTYTKYTGTVTEQDTTPYYYKATDAIFVVFDCYWVKKDGSTSTCYKLPFKHTITVGTQYLDGTRYKELGTVADVIQHMGDPTYISVTKHYLNDSDVDHTGKVEIGEKTYNYYLALDNSSEPMFSGMSKTYLTQYTNMYKLKIVQQFHDGDTTTDILTNDISGDGCADMNEAICELRDRATGNSVVDMYTPYDLEYYYVAKKGYNAETPNDAALGLIKSTIEHFEASEPDTNYVYLFCYKDAPFTLQYGGGNFNCYALYFRAYARINNKITALNWKPVVPYSIESKRFVYPAIIDLTGCSETYPVPVSRNFNTNYPIYMNDFVQVYMNTYNNLDNLFIEDGRAMKKVNSWQQNGNVPHFRRVIGERTTTMTGDEKVDYFLYHKKTLVTEVPDKIIPESLTYDVAVEGFESASMSLKMGTNLSDLDTASYNAYDGIRARALALAYMLDDADSQLDVSTPKNTLKLYELMAAASVIGKYNHIDWSPSDSLILKTGNMDELGNQEILFYELPVPGTSDTGYYVAPGTYGYTIIDEIFKPLELVDDFDADAHYQNLYSFKLSDSFKSMAKIFGWTEMMWTSPIAGDELGVRKFYYALYYMYDNMFMNNTQGYIDIIMDYYDGVYNYGSGSRSKDGLPLLDYFYNINTMISLNLGGITTAKDFQSVASCKLVNAYSDTVPTLSDVKAYYESSLCEAEWFYDTERKDNFTNIGRVGDYRIRYDAQVTIPQDPIISTDKQAREYGLTKGFYATSSQNYTASSVYAPYTRTSEPSDWATADYYTKSGNTYIKYTGAWNAGTTYYYKIPNHVTSLFSRNAIVRFLVNRETLSDGKQRSVIEIRKWNRFTKTWTDLGIEQSVHTAVDNETTDVPSYPTTGHEMAQVNDRNFEQYNEVINEIRTEVDGNSTLIANKINQLVNVINGLVFANLAATTNQNFAEFAAEYGDSLVTPFNYSPTDGVLYDGTAADIPAPPQYVRRVDGSGAVSTNNIVATNESIEIKHAASQVGWEAMVPRGRVKNL